MEIELKLEEEKDYKIVEELTREAFWNIYIPGADEHLLVRNLRKRKEFVQDLDFVAICDDEIVGNIVYAEAKIIGSEQEHVVLTFGPISVLPVYQNKGIGSKLIKHTIPLAKKMGYKAVIINGDPEYYGRFGFKESKQYNITNKDGKYPAALLVLELFPNALKGIEGKFDVGTIYEFDKKDLEEFEKEFHQKEKQITKTQERFNELSAIYL